MKIQRILLAASLLWLASGASTRALDWPQWRGPDRTDVSKETGLLKAWPLGGPARLWLYNKAGAGYSGPAISGGKLFTMGVRDDTDHLIALDEATGKELWATSLGVTPFTESHGDGPRGTPTVDGTRVYALGGKGTLLCANTADGTPLWKVAMKDFGGEEPDWGYTESVLVDGNRVVCTPGGRMGAMVALDKTTGKLIWRSRGFVDPAQYSSMAPATINGIAQYVQLTMSHITGVRAIDGQVLWQSPWPGETAVISTPIVRSNQVYVSSGYGVGDKSVRIGANGQAVNLYQNKTMKNHHGGMVQIGDCIYGYSGDGDTSADGWICQDFRTGAQVWSSKQFGKGALTSAEGMLYCLDENTGGVVLVEASPAGWKEHGRLTLSPQSRQRGPDGMVWTHPVVSNGRLYLRDQEYIYCYDIKSR